MRTHTKKTDLFVDTAGWSCYLDDDDPLHKAAVEVCKGAVKRGRKLVTTNYVLGELVALLSSRTRLSRQTIIQSIDTLRARPFVEVIHVDTILDDSAWSMLRQYLDKEWSLVDAASFVIMQQYGLTEALTTDHHFTQAGFVRLPSPA